MGSFGHEEIDDEQTQVKLFRSYCSYCKRMEQLSGSLHCASTFFNLFGDSVPAVITDTQRRASNRDWNLGRPPPPKLRRVVSTLDLQEVSNLALNGSILSMNDALLKVYIELDKVISTETGSSSRFREALDIQNFLNDVGRLPSLQEYARVCCMDKAVAKPTGIFCSEPKCGKQIQPKDVSYCLQRWQSSLTDAYRVRICANCFNNAKWGIKVHEWCQETCDHVEKWVRKTEFQKFVDKLPKSITQYPTKEPSVRCLFCRTTLHEVCTLYDEFTWRLMYSKRWRDFSNFFNTKYVCKHCRTEILRKNGLPETPVDTIIFTPENMMVTDLSDFIEKAVMNYVYENQHRLSEDTTFCVREVSSILTEYEAKPHMKKELEKKDLKSKWTYMKRTFLLFMKQNTKISIPIFCLIIGEYAQSKWIAINFIDSLQFLEPKELRSGMYHEVVLAYIATARDRGFTNLSFWACPASQHDEYVFFGRPEEQLKAQAPDRCFRAIRLVDWYETMLRKGQEKGIVASFRQAKRDYNPWNDFLTANYFDGDLLGDLLETIIPNYYADKQKAVRKPTRRKSQGQIITKTINERLHEAVTTACYGEVFMVQLAPPSNGLVRPMDTGIDVRSPYYEDRDRSLGDSKENLYDFKDLRRAEYTSMKACAHTHQLSTTSCKTCKKNVTHGLYCWNEDCFQSQTVFCSNQCAEGHVVRDKHKNCLRRFVAPYHNLKFHSHPVFREILRILNMEQEFICQFLDWVESSEPNANYDPTFQAVATTIYNHHLDVESDCQRNMVLSACKPCIAMFMFLRHAEVCKGHCNIVGHNPQIKFDEENAIRQ